MIHRLPRTALLLPLVLALGCNKGGEASEENTRLTPDGSSDVAAPAEPPKPATGGGDAADGRLGYSGAVQQQAAPGAPTATPPGNQPPSNPAAVDSAPPRMIIRTGTAMLEVNRLEPAIARVEQMARQLGGYVANTSMQGGSQDAREASLEVKLPAARWDQAVAGLRPLGKLESLTTSTEDVGEEYVDVTARMNNARRLEQRLVELLATRTGRLEDVLAVERELARVREEIERYEGRLRFLRSRVALSTLTVRLHEPVPVIGGRPGGNPIVRAFREAWDNFVAFMAGLIAMLGWLVPLGLIVAALVWLLRHFVRWRPRSGGGQGPGVPPGAAPPAPPGPPPAGPAAPPPSQG